MRLNRTLDCAVPARCHWGGPVPLQQPDRQDVNGPREKTSGKLCSVDRPPEWTLEEEAAYVAETRTALLGTQWLTPKKPTKHEESQMSPVRKTALVAGLLYLLTFV